MMFNEVRVYDKDMVLKHIVSGEKVTRDYWIEFCKENQMKAPRTIEMICRTCRQEFIAKTVQARFCSQKCRNIDSLEKRQSIKLKSRFKRMQKTAAAMIVLREAHPGKLSSRELAERLFCGKTTADHTRAAATALGSLRRNGSVERIEVTGKSIFWGLTPASL